MGSLTLRLPLGILNLVGDLIVLRRARPLPSEMSASSIILKLRQILFFYRALRGKLKTKRE